MLAGGIRILQGLQEGWRGGDEGYRMGIEKEGRGKVARNVKVMLRSLQIEHNI